MHPSLGQDLAALTSNRVAHLGKVDPACSFHRWVPSLLNWKALYYNGNTGEQGDENGDPKTTPDKPNLNFISHNSKKEGAHSSFTYTNYHDTSHLAENFIHGGFGVDNWVTDISKQSP